MAGKSLDDIWRQMQSQRAAEQQQRLAQERAIYEQRERQRQEYLQRMRMYEFASPSFSPSSAAAGAGGGSIPSSQEEDFPQLSAQAYILTWADINDSFWKFTVYNFDTGQLSDIITTDLLSSEWDLDFDDRSVQDSGFAIGFVNQSNTDIFKIYFINVNGTVVKSVELDRSEDSDFQYTENAGIYFGLSGSNYALYHFDGSNVRTHTFEFPMSIEVDDSGGDDVTAGGSIIIEAPNNTNYFIARTSGELVDVSQIMSGANSFYTQNLQDFIAMVDLDVAVKIISEQGELKNTFDLTSYANLASNIGSACGDNFFFYELTDYSNTNLLVVYDGDTNQFVSKTFSKTDILGYKSKRIQSAYSSSSNTLVNILRENPSDDSLGYICESAELHYLPKGETEFISYTWGSTVSIIEGTGFFTSNRNFTNAENPIMMFSDGVGDIIVGFLRPDGFMTQSTGIIYGSCSNIWGHAVAGKTFAIFDVGSDRIWQIYGETSIEEQTQTGTNWNWGSFNLRCNRNGTLVVKDSDDTSNSFIYTTEIGLTAGPTSLGNIYNEINFGIKNGTTREHQVYTKFVPGEEVNEYVEGFYLISKSGLSEYTEFFDSGDASASNTWTINDLVIGSEILSFDFNDTISNYRRTQVYNLSTLALIDDYEVDLATVDSFNAWPYDNRYYSETITGANLTYRLAGINGVEILSVSQSQYNREANDAIDND
jgi:hypothetical protein